VNVLLAQQFGKSAVVIPRCAESLRRTIALSISQVGEAFCKVYEFALNTRRITELAQAAASYAVTDGDVATLSREAARQYYRGAHVTDDAYLA
jgi:hypothetical protein